MTTNLTADRFGTPTNAKKYTLAVWFKLSKNNRHKILSYNYGSGNIGIVVEVRTNDQTFRVNEYIPGSDRYDVRTYRALRDYGAWYHAVVAYDSTQSTAADRVKIYINGVQQTSFAASSYPSQDLDSFISATPNNNKGFIIGASYNSSGNIDATNYFCGYMSQYIFVDGTAYAPSTFGSTDSNGVWVPNASPSVTYGTNGFKLEMKHSGASAAASNFGADTSGNNNHFTSNNLGTNPTTKDSPTNVFAIMNSNSIFPNSTPIITDAGLKTQSQSTSGAGLCSTIAVSAGKWYAEGKIGSGSTLEVGAVDIGSHAFATKGTAANSIGYNYGGGIGVNNSNVQTGVGTFTAGDIIGIALNMDSATGTVTFYKNGSAVGSPQNFTTSKPQFAAFYMQSHTSSGNQSVEWNYGNPTFAIASGNADANGYGNFEYAVPSGYYALCTKNVGQYGG